MTWTPISGIIPQYSTSDNALAGDYYLKFYAAGTTTPINMATDSTGSVELAKCALSSDGYPITNPLDDNTKFIPHIDQNYRVVLYKSEADADADNTSESAFNIDGLVPDIAPFGDAADITLRNTTALIQDDYDRSPLFVDGEDFTAGAGPHVITVPSDWNPADASTRFYKLASNGIVTQLTPTSKDATTFTISETLSSTDVLFIGDNGFRNQFSGDPADARERLSVITQSETENLVDTREAPAIAGYTGVDKMYLRDVITNTDFLDITAYTVSSWHDIGKTGSGAANIWTALDGLPSNVRMLRLLIDINHQYPSTSDIVRYLKVFLRKNGATTSLGLEVQSGSYVQNAGGTQFTRLTEYVDVPVSNQGVFDLKLDILNSGFYSVVLRLVGFGV